MILEIAQPLKENFVVMKELTGPIIGLYSMRSNSVVIDTAYGLEHLPHLKIQVKTAPEMNAKLQVVLADHALAITPKSTITITFVVDHPSECNTTGNVKQLEKSTETTSLLISQSVSRKFNRKVTVTVTNKTQSLHTITKHTQVAEFSVVTLDQSKIIKPVDTAILSLIPEGNPNLRAYFNRLLRKLKPGQQSNSF